MTSGLIHHLMFKVKAYFMLKYQLQINVVMHFKKRTYAFIYLVSPRYMPDAFIYTKAASMVTNILEQTST